MVVYNFKKITPIPPANEFIDIVLTRTQRKTPTVIHPGFKISRIRSFYMRKIKFTQQTIDEKLGIILTDFPRLDDTHPFYADLMNILYDRDHFKLALGQINTAKNLVGNLSKDYLRLMKYADSLYRCKQLKRAALGRMMTLLKKLKASLGYLEEIRKHMSRLPALDPNTRTLLLTGYPNVGKSSFMNKVTRADVDVQPYAFTTKALFVGHMDHRFLRWQVVDTPGILDRPLEERNIIEMQAITALAHLQCCVLYFLDVSEQCGFPLDEQLKLFKSIRPLFANKQIMMVANKIDVCPYESLSAQQRAEIEETARDAGAELIHMSNVSEENVGLLKTTACDKLLEARVDAKLSGGRVKDDVMARVTVSIPQPRDEVVRGAFIPESVLAKTKGAGRMDEDSSKRSTEKDNMLANGGAGVYSCDYRKYYKLEDEDWKFDDIPQFMDGKNVMDYFADDIEDRLAALEEEEAELEARGAYDLDDDEMGELDEEEMLLYKAIKEKQELSRLTGKETRRSKQPRERTLKHRDLKKTAQNLDEVGLESGGVVASLKARSKPSRKRNRASSEEEMEVDDADEKKRRKTRTREISTQKFKPNSKTSGPKTQLKGDKLKQALKKEKSLERRNFREARRGESDRVHYPKLVKHMNSGKSSIGTSTIGR